MSEVTDQALELIRLRAEGVASEAQTRELNSLLRANPDLVDLYVEYLLLDQALMDRARESEGARAVEDDKLVTRPQKIRFPLKTSNRPLAARWFLAAATVVVFGVGYFWSTNSSNLVRATVVVADQAELRNHPGRLEPGMSLALRRVELNSGRLEVELDSGVRLEMIAPFNGTLVDPMQLRLVSGRLNAEVREKGHGFTVKTDAGDVIDLGTRFGIEAEAGGECRVAVFAGEVELRPSSTNGVTTEQPAIKLTEGQAARFSAAAGLRRWQEVALAAKAAGISSQPYEGVVATIQDNLEADGLHPFYGLVQGGMREGSIAYTDKPRPAWLADVGAEFPTFLVGADLIRTYHQFRGRLNYRLRLELREPAEVFVIRDVREAAPDWLKSQFEDTGVRLRVGPWNPAVAEEPGVRIQANEPYLIAAIWRRAANAGVIELGSARANNDDTQTMMYGIAVKPRSQER